MAERGIETVGIDISQAFLRAAGEGAWVRADARRLPLSPKSFDVAISLCQGGFGLVGGYDDARVLSQMAECVKDDGRLVLSAFSAYFAVRHLEEGDTFDAATGVNHERSEVRSPTGTPATFDLWTTCFTPRELSLMATAAGLTVESIWSVSPGDYRERPPDLDHPEFLLVAAV